MLFKYFKILNPFKDILNIFRAKEKKSSFLYFLYEITIFASLAAISAFVISFPLFYISSTYPVLFKKLGFVSIILILLALFLLHFKKAFNKTKLDIQNNRSSVYKRNQHKLLKTILTLAPAFSNTFPLWIKSFAAFVIIASSVIVAVAIINIALFTLIANLFNIVSEGFVSTYLSVFTIIKGGALFIYDYWYFVLAFYSIFLAVLLLFSAYEFILKYPKTKWLLATIAISLYSFIAFFIVYLLFTIVLA